MNWELAFKICVSLSLLEFFVGLYFYWKYIDERDKNNSHSSRKERGERIARMVLMNDRD